MLQNILSRIVHVCYAALLYFTDFCPPDADDCPSTSRCLSLNATGESICLQSCFLENGGCNDDEFCITSERDTDCDLSEPCSSVRCVETAGRFLTLAVVYKSSQSHWSSTFMYGQISLDAAHLTSDLRTVVHIPPVRALATTIRNFSFVLKFVHQAAFVRKVW